MDRKKGQLLAITFPPPDLLALTLESPAVARQSSQVACGHILQEHSEVRNLRKKVSWGRGSDRRAEALRAGSVFTGCMVRCFS